MLKRIGSGCRLPRLGRMATASVLAGLDATTMAGLFQDTGAASPVTAPGQAVARARNYGSWTPQFLQASGANQPVWSDPGLTLDGAADFLGLDCTDRFTTISHLFLITFELTSIALQNTLINLGPATGNGRLTINIPTTGRLRTELRSVANTTLATADAIPSPVITTGQIYTAAIQIKDDLLSVSLNGLPVTEGVAFAASSGNAVYTLLALGAQVTNGTTTANRLAGKIHSFEIEAV